MTDGINDPLYCILSDETDNVMVVLISVTPNDGGQQKIKMCHVNLKDVGPPVSPSRCVDPQVKSSVDCIRPYTTSKKGHHHNGDRAAGRPHILCSICVHSFGDLAKAVRLFKASPQSQEMSNQTCFTDILAHLKVGGLKTCHSL